MSDEVKYWKLKESSRVIAVSIEVILSPRWEESTEEEYLEWKESDAYKKYKEDRQPETK